MSRPSPSSSAALAPFVSKPAQTTFNRDSRRPVRGQRRMLFHFSKRFDNRARLVAFASRALLNRLREERLDSA
jgi:hypothetical protein